MPKAIEFDISPLGAVKMEAQGFTGTACQKHTDGYVTALGGKPGTISREAKPEMFEQGGAVEQVGG